MKRVCDRERVRSVAITVVTLGLWFHAGQAMADPCKAISDDGRLPSYIYPGARFSGPVTYVGDGDSLCVGMGRLPSEWVEVRLADFYAPELHEPGGARAKAALESIASGRQASCVARHRSFDRIVAQCAIGGRSIGDQMRDEGIVEGGRGR